MILPYSASHLTLSRIFRVSLFLLAVLIAVFLLALFAGSTSLDVPVVFKGICSLFPFSGAENQLPESERTILFSIRIPRILFAGIVGASLSCSGVVFQGLLRNPLADPYVLGVSGGAATGAIIAIMLGLDALSFGVPAFAFAGAVSSILLVWGLSGARIRMRTERVLLSGVIVNAFFSALIMFFVSVVGSDRTQSVIFWLMGDLGMAEGKDILLATIFLVAGFTAMLIHARELNVMLTGEDTAIQLGVSVNRTRMILLLSASLVTGVAVSMSGIIGFVGLMVPHIVRMLFGSDNRLLFPASALFGAAFLIVADAIARTVLAPSELPVGVITALCGAPYFAYLMKRSN
jgi:iron complex transport system permease protein